VPSTVLLLLALLVTGLLGTETGLLFFWPGATLLGLCGFLTAARWKIRLSFAPSDLCLLTALLLTLYLSGRALTSPVVQYAREDLFVVLGAFVAYLITTTVVSHPRWRLSIVAVLVLLVLGNLAVGFVQFSGQWAFHVVPGFARTFGEGRVGGFFNNANHLAAFLLMAGSMFAGLLCFSRSGASARILLGFLCLASGIGLALTQSRGGVISAAVAVGVFALLALSMVWRTQRWIFGKLLGGVLVLGLLGGAVLYQVGAEGMKKRFVQRRADHDVRTPIWDTALSSHSVAPLLGNGARMFTDDGITYRSSLMQSRDLDPFFVHNEYLQMLTDYGWVGLGLLVLAVVAHFAHGLRFLLWFAREKFAHTATLQSNSLGLALGAVAGLCGVLVHAGVEFHFHVAATAITAAVLAGMLANPGFDAETARSIRLPLIRPVAKVALLLAGAGLLYGSYQQAPADYAVAQANIAASQGDMVEQVDRLSEAIERCPHAPEPFYRRGLAWMDQWRPDLPKSVSERLLNKAVRDFQQATALAPSHYLYPLALADAYDALQQEPQANAAVQLALKAAPWHEESRLGLAIHLHRWLKFEEAERAYLWASKARMLNPNEAMRWNDGYDKLMRDALTVAAKP
jgi:O-antigen ligase